MNAAFLKLNWGENCSLCVFVCIKAAHNPACVACVASGVYCRQPPGSVWVDFYVYVCVFMCVSLLFPTWMSCVM